MYLCDFPRYSKVGNCPVFPVMLFRLEINTSGYATWASLSQLCNDAKWQSCMLYFQGADSAKRNYEVHDKELLSVIWGLKEWRHVLEGTKHTIEILNDHRNLMYFRTSQNLNCQQACWSLWLAWFNFSLVLWPGQHLMKPDALSHQVDHQMGEEDNQDQVMRQQNISIKRGWASVIPPMGTPTQWSIAVSQDSPIWVTIEGEGSTFLERVQNCAIERTQFSQPWRSWTQAKAYTMRNLRKRQPNIL